MSGPHQQLCLRAWSSCRAELAAAARRGTASSGEGGGVVLKGGATTSLYIFPRHLTHAAASTSGRPAGVIDRLLVQRGLRRGMATAAAAAAAARGGAATTATATATGVGAHQQPRVTGMRALARDLKQLSKARLSLLVALTASTGYVLGDAVEDQQEKTRSEFWRGVAATTGGTWLAAASANSLNQLYEQRNDAAMRRTCLRPLPSGRMAPRHAALFALASGAAGVALLARESGETAAGLGAANIALYAGVYTPLKQITAANTWVGAVVGAIPPLMGWAAGARRAGAEAAEEEQGAETASAGGFGAELRHPGAWVLALGLFSWQMPHFMALAWMCRDDYRAGGFRMLSTPAAAAGVGGAAAARTELAVGRRVAAVAVRHSLLLLPLGAAAAWLGLAEPGWHAAALSAEGGALAAAMVAASAAFWARPDQQTARRAFRASLAYLPVLMLGMVVHRRRSVEKAVAPLAMGVAATMVVEEQQRGRQQQHRAPPQTWGEVRDRLADAGWWWSSPGALLSTPSSMSVRLRLRSPEERVAGAVLLRKEAGGGGGGEQAASEAAVTAAAGRAAAAPSFDQLIAELRAALGLTHCPSRVYGEAIEGAEEEVQQEEDEDEEEEEASGRRRRR